MQKYTKKKKRIQKTVNKTYTQQTTGTQNRKSNWRISFISEKEEDLETQFKC